MQQAEHQQQQQQQQQQNGTLNSADIAGPSGLQTGGAYAKRTQISGGRFDFEDGGTYCGGWDEGKAHGHGVCTGPKHQGAFAGAWNYGFEVSGSYIWPSGSHYEGQWQNGRRHGLGVEQIGRQIYRGEWSKDGHKGRYGVRESTVSTAKYEGTWNTGYQDGYGVETYADGGKYQGQWQEGKRHGYGIRTSAPFGLASHHRRKHQHASLNSLHSNENPADAEKRNAGRSEEIRGGFVLVAKSDKPLARRNSLSDKTKKGFLSGLKIRKQRSTGDLEKRGTLASGSIRSTMSTASWLSTGSEQSNLTARSAHTESNASFTMEDEQLDPTVVETYMGEWKKDKRCGYGVAERSDGLKYEGEWYNNKKQGYGVTTFRDGTVEEGKYKNNILISSQKKTHLFLARSRKFTERITTSVNSAQRALKMAMQRSDIAISRTATAAAKAQNADMAAEQARADCELAVQMAREFAPDFKPTVLERFEKLRIRERFKVAPPPHLSPTASAGSPMDNFVGNNVANQRPQPPGQTYQQNQSRRPSHGHAEYPAVPSSMYSQQLPVTPQTDLSSLVAQSQAGHSSSISAIKQMYHQQQSQQMQQQQLQHQQQMQMQQQQMQQQQLQQQQLQQQMQHQQQMQMQQQKQMELEAAQMHQQHQQRAASSSMGMSPPPQSQQQQQQQQLQQQSNSLMNPAYQYQQQQPPGISNIYSSNTSNPSPSHNELHQDSAMFRDAEATHTLTNMQQQQIFQQQHQQHMQSSPNHIPPSLSRRPSAQPQSQDSARQKPPMLGQTNQQPSIDHFDHYKRPPSRDSSIDRYARAASRMSGGFGSRQASVDRNNMTGNTVTDGLPSGTPENRPRAGSVLRSGTPVPQSNGSLPTGRLSRAGTPSLGGGASMASGGGRMGSAGGVEAMYSSPQQPFEDVLLRQRTLGQDIIPSPLQPKRTESLYMPAKPATPVFAGGGAGGGGKKGLKSVPINVTLQRKKSLPDFQELPRATEAMSREEVSALGSARREAVRRQIEVNERLKANPLLYLVSPQVKDWFSRQQLVLLVLFANIVLAIIFVKMLT